MGKLTDEQIKQLRELEQLRDSPDPADDFDIEIWDDSGKGARVPYSKGRPWVQRIFGIDLDEDKPEDEAGDESKPEQDGKPAGADVRRFGRRVG